MMRIFTKLEVQHVIWTWVPKHIFRRVFHLTENDVHSCSVPENIFRRLFLIENVLNSDSISYYYFGYTDYINEPLQQGTHFLKFLNSIYTMRNFTKREVKHVMDSATPDKFLENPSYMPSLDEKDKSKQVGCFEWCTDPQVLIMLVN